ncbi:MAG: hypothetical protein ACREC9_11875 [Methylocella sp.]
MDHQFEEKLNALDLEPMLFVLVHAKDGPKWTPPQSIIAERWYKRFHALIHEYPSQTIVPSKVIDTIWHAHILDTQKYINDCIDMHGEIIHHFPYLGIRSRDDRERRENLYRETIGLFIDMFGESPEDIEPLFGHAPQDGAVICAGPIASEERPRLSLAVGPH